MKYAYVKVGDYVIPFIGIAPAATEETCDQCGATLHLQSIRVDESGKFHCLKCADEVRLLRRGDRPGRARR